MTKIYLIRHAEAEGNLYRRIHGNYNALLTENGYRQIAALEQRFRDIPIDAVYASDLYRTMTTARAIYIPKNLPLQTDKRLREIHMGVWEDITFGEAYRNDNARMGLFGGGAAKFKIDGGETFEMVSSRMIEVLQEIAQKHPNQTVAVFTHGSAIRNLCSVLKPEAEEKKHCDNTAVTELSWENGTFTLLYEGDASHLSDEISTFARQSWWKGEGAKEDINFWFRPFEEATDKQILTLALADAVQGKGQDDSKNPIYTAMAKQQPAGMVQYNKAGEILLFYLLPDMRKQGLAVQLLGQAISPLRELGHEWITVDVKKEQTDALAFFRAHGFVEMKQQAQFISLKKYIGYDYEQYAAFIGGN